MLNNLQPTSSYNVKPLGHANMNHTLPKKDTNLTVTEDLLLRVCGLYIA